MCNTIDYNDLMFTYGKRYRVLSLASFFDVHNHKVIRDHHIFDIDVRNHLPVWIFEAHVSHENRRVSNKSQILSFNLTVFGRMKRTKSHSVIQIRFLKTGVEIQILCGNNKRGVAQNSQHDIEAFHLHKSVRGDPFATESRTTHGVSTTLVQFLILEMFAHLFM